jgi:alpha-ketoglutarate-dependent taurine dioxygenase
MKDARTRLLYPDSRLPLLIEASSADIDLNEFVRHHGTALEQQLLEHGGILFRNFGVRSARDFAALGRTLPWPALEYIYRSTPRRSVEGGVYTASEYPADQSIPLHSENAFQSSWPLKVAFCCVTPALQGGETPLADLRRVSCAMGETLLQEFRDRKVRYVRNFQPHVDLSWQTVFQTEDPTRVKQYCDQNEMSCEWRAGGVLRTVQTCQGTARHLRTAEEVIFNQAHLFHVSSLGPQIADFLIQDFGVDGLPRHAFWGDGSAIGAESLTGMRTAFQSESRAFSWHSGDVLLIDNMQVAHGRNPYKGRREVLAMLMEQSQVGASPTGIVRPAGEASAA